MESLQTGMNMRRGGHPRIRNNNINHRNIHLYAYINFFFLHGPFICIHIEISTDYMCNQEKLCVASITFLPFSQSIISKEYREVEYIYLQNLNMDIYIIHKKIKYHDKKIDNN